MANVQVVYASTTDGASLRGALFAGQKFWLSVQVPSRRTISDQLRANGGIVVQREEDADVKVVDHLKPRAVSPGSYSYEYITKSIRAGRLEPLENHLVGQRPGSLRITGSEAPKRGTRTPFTVQDDRILYRWVTEHERKGSKVLGNEIYKQLAQISPRHPWEAWRARWVKTLSKSPRPASPPGGAAGDDSPRPGSVGTEAPHNLDVAPKTRESDFTEEEYEVLLRHAVDILDMPEEKVDEGWAGWAAENGSHTAQAWKAFFTNHVLPIHRRNVKRSRLVGQEIEVGESEEELSRPSVPLRLHANARGTSLERKSNYDPTSPIPLPSEDMSQGGIPAIHGSSVVGPTTPVAKTSTKRTFSESFDMPSRRDQATGKQPPKGSHILPNKTKKPFDSEIQQNDSASAAQRVMSQPGSRSQDTVPNISEQPSNSVFVESGRGDVDEDEAESETLADELDLAEPTGGWDDDLQLDEPPPSFQNAGSKRSQKPQSTQAILDSDTQAVDLNLAEPDGGWATAIATQGNDAAPVEETSQASTAEGDYVPALDRWIDERVLGGASEDVVITALKCTSMQTALAETLLQSLAQDGGIPQNMAGVWSTEDDDALMGTDGRRIKRVEEKHGKEAFEARWNFLKEYNS